MLSRRAKVILEMPFVKDFNELGAGTKKGVTAIAEMLGTLKVTIVVLIVITSSNNKYNTMCIYIYIYLLIYYIYIYICSQESPKRLEAKPRGCSGDAIRNLSARPLSHQATSKSQEHKDCDAGLWPMRCDPDAGR